MKKTETQKGITLVALIITIIVLLILAVVAIRAVTGDGIIQHAKNSKEEYEKAQREEASRVLEYEYQIASAQGVFIGTYDEYLLEKTYGLKIGDYVDYSYDAVSNDFTVEATSSGHTIDQTITHPTTQLKWRVLGLDENGNIELICAAPDKTQKLYLQGVAGYNNGVYLINDICEKLYSNTELGIKARSLNIEDIEEQFSEVGKNARNNGYINTDSNMKYGEIKSYSTNNKYPLIYAEEAKSGVNGTIREGGIEKSVAFYSKENLTAEYRTAQDKDGNNTSLNTTQTYYYFSNPTSSYFKNEIFYSMIFGTGTHYWIASRYVNCNTDGAYFGIRRVGGDKLDGYFMFYSDGNELNFGSFFRPVVSLPSNISIDTSTGNGTADSMYSFKK